MSVLVGSRRGESSLFSTSCLCCRCKQVNMPTIAFRSKLQPEQAERVWTHRALVTHFVWLGAFHLCSYSINNDFVSQSTNKFLLEDPFLLPISPDKL